MDIHINRNKETPIFMQIVYKIRDMIISGELNEGYKLPSERKLAETLNIHRNTVVKAYGELVSEGYLAVSRTTPKGYFVKEIKDINSDGNKREFFPLKQMINYTYNEKETLFLNIFNHSYDKDFISLGGITISQEVIPTKEVFNIMKSLVEKGYDQHFLLPQDDEVLRMKNNICKLLLLENMYIKPRNIQLVSETNQALEYLTRLYVKEGDCVIAEEPMVPDNVSIFRNRGINLITVPMEEDGMDINKVANLIKKHNPKFIYTMPNFHNPTGYTMSLEKREKLLKLSSKYNIPIIEEDSQRDFRYEEHKIPSLYSMDKRNLVVYIDSFTLTFPYSIKTGYIVGPYNLVDTLGKLITVEETYISNLGQYMLNEFIENGYYFKHIQKIQNYYKNKLNLLCKELDKIKNQGISYHKPEGGILLWCDIEDYINEKKLFQNLADRKVLVVPGFVFFPNGYNGKGHLRFCFGNISDENIIEAVKIIGEELKNCKY